MKCNSSSRSISLIIIGGGIWVTIALINTLDNNDKYN
jgi:hypothetical protein